MNSTMKMLMAGAGALALALVAVLAISSGGASAHEPTCAEDSIGLNIDQHGDHIVRDYVIGADGTGPAGEGAEIPGGPGPRFHFAKDIPPGASFCTGAQSINAVQNNQIPDHVAQ
jgi:hypothetical protein